MTEPLKVLDRLGDELERVARDGARRRRRRLTTPPRRVLVLALLTAGLIAATALAASGLLTGEPVKNPPGMILKSDRGLGTPIPSTVRLVDLRVPDPDGGLPWGLRTMRTTRGMACVQIGRVQDGKLGILGQDGAFDDDGRFHELPPEVLYVANCGPTDGAGHGFVAVSAHGMPASGYGPGPGCAPRAGEGARGVPTCPERDLRRLYYGLLGPEGAAVTYHDAAGRRGRTSATGPDGAYLIVLRSSRKDVNGGSGWVPSTTPLSGLDSVRYRDGSVCRIPDPRRLGGARPCPAKGWVAPKTPHHTLAQLRTPVRATVSPRPVIGPKPPHRISGFDRRFWRVTVSFRTRVASDERGFYVLVLIPARQRDCPIGGLASSITRDLRPGQSVREELQLPFRCRGEVLGTLRYDEQRRTAPSLVPGGAMFKGPVAGRFTVTIPRP